MKRMKTLQFVAILLTLTIARLVSADSVSNQFAVLNAVCSVLLSDPLDSAASKSVLDLAKSATNDEVRCRSMTIATIGTILRGDSAAYHQYLMSLQKTFPKNPISNMASFDNMSSDCSICGGSGKGQSPCTKCINWKGKCDGCRGRGTVTEMQFNRPDSQVKCPTCKGSARCNNCGGSGNVEVQCKNCAGSGRGLSKDKARNVYIQLVKESSDFCYQQMHPEIEKINNAIATAKTQGDVNMGIRVLQEVIATYPQAENVNLAKEMLAFLQDRQRSVEESEKIRKASEQEARERLLAQQQQQLKSIGELSDLTTAIRLAQKFINDNPDSPYISDAQVLLRELQRKSDLVNSTGL